MWLSFYQVCKSKQPKTRTTYTDSASQGGMCHSPLVNQPVRCVITTQRETNLSKHFVYYFYQLLFLLSVKISRYAVSRPGISEVINNKFNNYNSKQLFSLFYYKFNYLNTCATYFPEVDLSYHNVHTKLRGSSLTDIRQEIFFC